jgi:hypothetical protein
MRLIKKIDLFDSANNFLKWYPHYVDSFIVFVDQNKLFLILSAASGQAGEIGI